MSRLKNLYLFCLWDESVFFLLYQFIGLSNNIYNVRKIHNVAYLLQESRNL